MSNNRPNKPKIVDFSPVTFLCRDGTPLEDLIDQGWQIVGWRPYPNGFPYCEQVLLMKKAPAVPQPGQVIVNPDATFDFGKGRW